MTPDASEAARRGTGAVQDCWDLSGRDVVPDLRIEGATADAGAAFLYGFLSSDGSDWSPPYAAVRQALGIRRKPIEPESQEAADSRIRTWMVYFRGLGLLYEADGKLHVTAAGKRLRSLIEESMREVDLLGREVAWADRWRLARSVIGPLARYQLRNPLTADEYPDDTDMFPLWAIWRVMRELDNKIHWEEFGRVLTKCLHRSDLDAAIETIRAARQQPDYDVTSHESMDNYLGPRCPDMGDDGDQRDRIIVWLSRAGFKDLLIEHRSREDGYRYLQQEFLPLIDAAIAVEPQYTEFDASSEYFDWVGGAPAFEGGIGDGQEEDEALQQLVRQCSKYAATSLITLVGPAGVGKTRLTYAAAKLLSDRDDERLKFIQFHAAFTYEEFMGGLAPNDRGGFVPQEGLFLKFNAKALADLDSTYVLVIDELSRADLSNVLGELLTYVEYRNRAFEVPALAGSYRVAPNLIILATMNEKDRSVVNLDDATVRRLRFFPVERSTEALVRILDEAGMAPALRDEVVSWFEGLPDDAPFGHGLFVRVATEEDLHELWHQQLKYFLRRGGVTVYPDPTAIERGYRWRRLRATDTGQSEGGDEEAEVLPTEGLIAAEEPADYASDETPAEG